MGPSATPRLRVDPDRRHDVRGYPRRVPRGRRLVLLKLLGRAVQPLLWLGALGIALSAACVVIAVTRGLIIPREGDLTKVITFDLALGIYVITIAFIVPLARYSATGQRLWVGLSIVMAMYAFGMETIQQLRGIDARFTHVGGPVDALVGAVFGLSSPPTATRDRSFCQARRTASWGAESPSHRRTHTPPAAGLSGRR